MNLTVKISGSKLKHQLVTAVMICVSAVCFAIVGDGRQKASGKQSLLTPRPTYNYKQFSLKPTYSYRGSDLLKAPVSGNSLKINTSSTYQKGNTTYILPMKKKVIDKVKFTPTPSRF